MQHYGAEPTLMLYYRFAEAPIALAAKIACRREPSPLSLLLVTVNVAINSPENEMDKKYSPSGN
jgi:hypothetical protein